MEDIWIFQFTKESGCDRLTEAKLKHKKVTNEEKVVLLENISSQTVQQTQKEIASFFGIPVEQVTRQKVQADESVRIELTLSKEAYRKLQRAQNLVSGAVADKDVASFIEYISDKIIQQRASANNAAPKKKPMIDEPPKQEPAQEEFQAVMTTGPSIANETNIKLQARNRVNVPAKTFSLPMWKRQTHAKQGCCQYKDPITGKFCGSERFLQVDHKRSRWANGGNEAENLQTLCAGHNKLKYRREVGITFG